MTAISSYRHWIKADGSSEFPAEAGRYHLYVAMTCPYAHRTLVVRELKGLQDVISITVTSYLQNEEGGWQFCDDLPHCTPDTLNGAKTMKELYLKINPEYAGRCSVPCLFDKKTKQIVNNESLDICKILSTEFDKFSATPEQAALRLYPEELRAKIDEAADEFGTKLGVTAMTAGLTKDQDVYDKSVTLLFDKHDILEERLSKHRYLLAESKTLTLADVCAFTHLIRFDWVFFLLWKCDKKRVVDYPHMWAYLRDLYQTGTIATTVSKEHIRGAAKNARALNPNGIVSIGPTLDFLEPHGRENL